MLYVGAQKATREALSSFNWPPKQTKERKYKKGIETGGEQTDCAVRVQVQTQINNTSTVCVHSGLKCDNLSGKCLQFFYYIESQINNNFNSFRKDWDAVLLVRLLGRRFHS